MYTYIRVYMYIYKQINTCVCCDFCGGGCRFDAADPATASLCAIKSRRYAPGSLCSDPVCACVCVCVCVYLCVYVCGREIE